MGGVDVSRKKQYPPLLPIKIRPLSPYLKYTHSYSKANGPDTHETVGVTTIALAWSDFADKKSSPFKNNSLPPPPSSLSL